MLFRSTKKHIRNVEKYKEEKEKKDSDTGPGWMGPLGCIGGSGYKPLIPEYPLCDTIWSNVFTLAGFAGQYVDLREYFKAATTNIGAMTMRWMLSMYHCGCVCGVSDATGEHRTLWPRN